MLLNQLSTPCAYALLAFPFLSQQQQQQVDCLASLITHHNLLTGFGSYHHTTDQRMLPVCCVGCRPLPDPLPWLISEQQQQPADPQQQQQQQEQVTPLQPAQVHRVTLELSALTRELAAEWQQQVAVVAVWDSGHHSSLAAAIRLSAVYRLPHVVLLQQP
jgi:hypothetical protein